MNQRIEYLEQQIRDKKAHFREEKRDEEITRLTEQYEIELAEHVRKLIFVSIGTLLIGVGSAIYLFYFVNPNSIIIKSLVTCCLIIAIYTFCVSSYRVRDLSHNDDHEPIREDTYRHAEDTVYRKLIREYDEIEAMKAELATLYADQIIKDEEAEKKKAIFGRTYDPEDRDYD